MVKTSIIFSVFITIVCGSEALQLETGIADDRRFCNDPSQCHDQECCVSLDQPIGKRTLEKYKGYCVHLGIEGSGCIVKFGNVTHPPDHLVFSCPCGPGVYCKGNGHFVVPLGETGTCTKPTE